MINSFFRSSFMISNTRFQVVHLFLSGAPSYFNYIISKLHLIIARLLPEFFSTFLFVWSFFYYRSSSWRIYMVVRQGFLSFFNCSSRFLSELRSAKLYPKINMVFNTCFVFEEFKHSSSCIPKCNSFSLIFWGGVMSLLTISLHVSWFNSVQEWDS